MSTEDIKTAIAEITKELKGPMSDTDRALLVADRSDMRRELAKRGESEGRA